MRLFGGVFEIEELKKELNTLNENMNSSDLWSDHKVMSSISKRKSFLELSIGSYNSAANELEYLTSLLKDLENDHELFLEFEDDLNKTIENLANKIEKLEIDSLFKNKNDFNDCFLEINSGAGGTESNDWAYILRRMYIRYAERNNFKIEIIEEICGDVTGIKSSVLKVCGPYANGLLSAESGVHRLVRISPFNANAKRHTSFVSVYVYPAIEDDTEIEINPSDLRIDTYRASGAGGQHVNKTDSAVRITHLPTNTVTQCQSDRSQHRNKNYAMMMLKAKLQDIKDREKKDEKSNINKSSIGWGSQIRSYVMQPYQMVKDIRSQYEENNIEKVLDGDIDKIIKSVLSLRKSLRN